MAARKSASRRQVLKMTGIGTLGLAVAPVVALETTRRVSKARAVAAPVATAAVATPAGASTAEAWLGDLVGRQLGQYAVASVGKIERGGIPVELATASGVRFRVDVLRFDPTDGERGIGEVCSVTVYLRNGGKGDKTTDEELGLGAMALANELARREREGAVPPSELLTMGERAASDASVT